jgi:mannose-6-phosphate isomerase-like protein (cupin superfamily)
MEIYPFKPGVSLLDTPNIRARVDDLLPGAVYPEHGHPGADEMFYFSGGQGAITADGQTFPFTGPIQAYIPAGTPYILTNTGPEPIRLIWAQAPNASADPPAGAGGPVWFSTAGGKDRFPDSSRVRGGFLTFAPNFECAYHSHDHAEEIFLFLGGKCRITVEGEAADVGVGEIVVVPAEHKHKLRSGEEPLLMWLTVTPNLKPSHTFYEERPDGTWKRITPRAGEG